jgi:hypothetical protein
MYTSFDLAYVPQASDVYKKRRNALAGREEETTTSCAQWLEEE